MRSSNKRTAAATNNVVAAKYSKNTVVPDEVTALLKNVALSIDSATKGFMNLACGDIAARGRLVAILADAKRLINHQLGVKRTISVLAVDDVMIDVLKFTCRKELDTMQLANRRCNTIILDKMVLLCLRQLRRAKLARESGNKDFTVILDEVGATKKHRFWLDVSDEAVATADLLNACRSSKLERLELYGVRDSAPLDTAFFGSMAQYAPAIVLNTLYTGSSKNVASSIDSATKGFMNLACGDIAARGRLVAILADAKRLINHQLGVKRTISVLAVDDVMIDVLKFTCRKELDTMQLANRRCNTIILDKMVLLCLRQLRRAKLARESGNKDFTVILDEVGATKKHRFWLDVSDEAVATADLLNACRSSKLERLELYGVRDSAPLDTAFFGSMAQYAPAIVLNTLYTGSSKVAACVPHDSVLQALSAFAELDSVKIGMTLGNSGLMLCLVRSCFKIGINFDGDHRDYRGHYRAVTFDQSDDGAVVKEALMDFCFGECDDRFATRDRSLRACVPTLERGFLREWIESADTITCRHKLTLHLEYGVAQDLTGIDTVELHGQGFGANKVYYKGTLCLVRSCFKIGINFDGDHRDYRGHYRAVTFDQSDDGAVVKEALMDFCFGECDDRFATRDRSLRACVPTLERGFLREWIESADTITCRHKLTLHLEYGVAQDLTGIDTVELHGQGFGANKVYYKGTRGPRWAAAYDSTYKTMELTVNH